MIKTYLVMYNIKYFITAFSFNSIYYIRTITPSQGHGFSFHDPFNRFALVHHRSGLVFRAPPCSFEANSRPGQLIELLESMFITIQAYTYNIRIFKPLL